MFRLFGFCPAGLRLKGQRVVPPDLPTTGHVYLQYNPRLAKKQISGGGGGGPFSPKSLLRKGLENFRPPDFFQAKRLQGWYLFSVVSFRATAARGAGVESLPGGWHGSGEAAAVVRIVPSAATRPKGRATPPGGWHMHFSNPLGAGDVRAVCFRP